MTKAERIFISTKLDCEKHIKCWGVKVNDDGTTIGFNCVSNDDDETVCTRTLNAMEKAASRYRRGRENSLRFGIIDQEKYNFDMAVLNMVETTIQNTRRAIL